MSEPRALGVCCFLSTLVLVACGEDVQDDPPRSSSTAGSRSLLDGLDEAELSGDGLAVLLGEREGPSADRLVFEDDFAEPEEWKVGRKNGGGAEKLPERLQPGPRQDGDRMAYYLPFALRRMHVDLPAAPEATYLVTAQMRSLGSPELSGIEVTALGEDPSAVADGREVRLLRSAHSGGAVHETLAEGNDWQQVVLFEGARPGRRGLRVGFYTGPGGVVIDSVEVRRLSLVERCRLEASDSDAVLRQHWMRTGQSWDSLLLPPPARVSFVVDVPPRARLEMATAILGEQEGDHIVLRVRVEGEEVGVRRHEHGRGALRESFAPWTVPLDQWSGREVELSFESEGTEGALALVGAPRLLAPVERSGPNLILISVDTLRADHLGCYGSEAGLTPTIDAMAERGLRFSEVTSSSSYTLPTHMTMFTGQHPILHGVTRAFHRLDPARSWTLGSAMRASGRVCGAFTGGGYVDPVFGYAAGFDSYDIRDPTGVSKAFLTERSFPEEFLGAAKDDPLAPTLDWIQRRKDQPFFLFLHTFLVHNYVPDEEYAARHVGTEDVGASGKELWRRALEERDQACVERLRELYRATLVQFDERTLARLLEFLEAEGLAEDTLIALVADHGESFLEHDTLGHGTGVWSEQTRVPWILCGAGVEAGRVVEDPVTLADVAPTLLALLGLAGDERWSGRDALAGRGASTRLLHLSTPSAHWDGLEEESWKIVQSWDGRGDRDAPQLYRVDRDRAEDHDVAASRPDVLEHMLQRMSEEKRATEERAAALPRSPPRGSSMDSTLRDTLKQLGYVDSESEDGDEER